MFKAEQEDGLFSFRTRDDKDLELISSSGLKYVKTLSEYDSKIIDNINKGAKIAKIKLYKKIKLEQMDSILKLLKNLSRRKPNKPPIDSAIILLEKINLNNL
jgi:hypothetical protein